MGLLPICNVISSLNRGKNKNRKQVLLFENVSSLFRSISYRDLVQQKKGNQGSKIPDIKQPDIYCGSGHGWELVEVRASRCSTML